MKKMLIAVLVAVAAAAGFGVGARRHPAHPTPDAANSVPPHVAAALTADYVSRRARLCQLEAEELQRVTNLDKTTSGHAAIMRTHPTIIADITNSHNRLCLGLSK